MFNILIGVFIFIILFRAFIIIFFYWSCSPSARCSLCLNLERNLRMVHKKTDLVIIGVSVGVAVGIFLAALVFFGIQWFKKHAHLRQSRNERSVSTLPIRTNGQGTSFDSSASLSNSVNIKVLDHPVKNSHLSWWSHHSKDRFPSASGIPRYHYKYVLSYTLVSLLVFY